MTNGFFLNPVRPQVWRLAVWNLAIWVTMATVFSIHFHFYYLVAWSTAFRWAAIDWAVWAGLSGLIYLLVRWGDQSGFRTASGLITLHAPGLLLFPAIQVGCVIAIDRLLGGSADLSFTAHFQALFTKKLGINFLTYAGFATVLHLLVKVSTTRSKMAGEGSSGQAIFLEKLLVTRGHREFFLNCSDIDYIRAAGNYAQVHTGGQSYLLRRTMKSLEAGLDPSFFLRTSRSTIVNLNRVRELAPTASGRFEVVLHDGTSLPLTRTFRKKLKQKTGDRF